MKRSQVRITFLGVLVGFLLFSGCQQSIPASSATATRQALVNKLSTFAVQTVIASFPSETPTPSITPTPTDTPVPTMIPPNLVVSEEILHLVPSSIISKGPSPKPGNAKVSPPTVSGNYLVYGTMSDDSLEYISPDGNIQGTLVDGDLYRVREPDLTIQGIDPSGIIENATPRWLFLDITGLHKQDPYFDTANIWASDLFGKSLNSWIVSPDPNLYCVSPNISNNSQHNSPYFSIPLMSRYYEWLGIDCLPSEGGHLLTLINLVSGDEKSLVIPCGSGDWVGFPSIYWSQNKDEFLFAGCTYGKYYFISLSGDQITAKRLESTTSYLRILTASPDLKYIVVDLGEAAANPDGTVSGHRIMVTDLDCVLRNDSHCNQGTVYNLPFDKPFDKPYPYPPDENQPDLEWSHSGNNLIWVTSGWMGQINLLTNTNHVFSYNTPGLLLGISPDDQWIIFLGEDKKTNRTGVFDVSIENDDVTHFLVDPNNMSGIVPVYGWLTIP